MVSGAVAWACAAGGLTLTIKKSFPLEDDVPDLGVRVGTLHPYPGSLHRRRACDRNRSPAKFYRKVAFPAATIELHGFVQR